jgi:hypothetical protein
MAINQIGKLNFGALPAYIFRAQDFGLFQTYLTSFLLEYVTSSRGVGIIYGGQITVVSGLTLQIAKGLAVMPNGQLVSFDQQQITLPAADPTNPRIDRLELAVTLTNNTTVQNRLLQSVVLDQIYVGAVSRNGGTPAVTPAAPVLTAANISLGLVTVNATQTVLTGGSINQSDDSATTFAAVILGDLTRQIRQNRASGNYEVSSDGATWTGVALDSINLQKFTLANNQVAAANVTGLLFDSTKVISGRADIDILRRTDTQWVRHRGHLDVWYQPETATWDCLYTGAGSGDPGIDFTITAAGQVQYASTNLTGANYAATLRFRARSMAQ